MNPDETVAPRRRSLGAEFRRYFIAGGLAFACDLLLSMRTRNLVLVLDPSSRQVKWWQVGSYNFV